MINLGIYAVKRLLAKHNTDRNVLKLFLQLENFVDINSELIDDLQYTISYNLNKIVTKLFSKDYEIVRYKIKFDFNENRIIYHYGNPIAPQRFFKEIGITPVIITTGFMTDNYQFETYGRTVDRQKEADILASSLEKANILHFHTEGGRQRFLNYRPEFEKKTVAIPFFLPYLKTANSPNKCTNDNINILFVGYEGIRKGLNEFIEALNLLGNDFLKRYSVKITVVSKDKPNTSLPISWFSSLPHSDVMNLMNEASIFVLVPKRESYGLVLLEAMSRGCVIITDNDETRKEIIGNAGLFVDYGNIPGLLHSLDRLIRDSFLREKLSLNALHRVDSLFLPNVVSKQYHKVFKTLIDQNNLYK